MFSDDFESLRDNRRRRIAHFKNNWGTDLQQIDEEDSADDILDRNPGSKSPKSPIGSRRSSTGSSCGSGSPPPHMVPRMRHTTSDLPLWCPTKSPSLYQQYVGTESFCDCRKERTSSVQCNCGENEDSTYDWTWNTVDTSGSVDFSNSNRDVTFHSEYSSGTAAVCGTKPMTTDQYFWEIKMASPVYGTDMMIGIGTEHNNLKRNESIFCSMLGEDAESWGFSYTGLFYHNGESRLFQRFSQGSIIGVHLDMWFGTLSFFRNRQSIGTACSGLRGKKLLPMVSSTAARSVMRIVRSKSFPSSLQFLCCVKLRQLVPSHLHVLESLEFPPGLSAFLKKQLDWVLSPLIQNKLIKRKADFILENETENKKLKTI